MSEAEKKSGRLYWQSLESYADTPEVRALMENEFAGYDPKAIASLPRRRFLKLMGASLALSGLTLSGCRRWPVEHLAPYAGGTPGRTPGVPEQYATTMELGGVARGLLATAYDGRPIKIEGNPNHPWSSTWGGRLGSADRYAQASVLEVYDPDRSRFVIERVAPTGPRQSNWTEFDAAFTAYLDKNCPDGAGFAVLSEASESPSVADMRARLMAALPKTQWFEYEPVSFDNESAGVKLATGAPGRAVLSLASAGTIVCLDGDFLGMHPGQTRYGNDFVSRRRSADTEGQMCRLYVAESTFSITGTNADERLPVKPSRIEPIAAALGAELGLANTGAAPALSEAEKEFVAIAAADLRQAGKAGVVVVGGQCSPATHALAALINARLGAIGTTVRYVGTPERPSHVAAIAGLSQEMRAGAVKALLILGGNPAYDAPADCDFAGALSKVGLTAHLCFYLNETSLACTWHLPRSHYLEAWGDGRAWDGTISTAQPLIEPIFGGKSTIELLAMITADNIADGQSIVRRTLTQITGDGSEAAWRRWIHDGVVPNTAYPALSVNAGAGAQLANVAEGKWEVRFVPHYGVYDGRFANLGWLLEMPDPLTKLTWDNAALISKTDADALGVTNNDMLSLTVAGRKLDVPAYILPGQPIGAITLALGFGRPAAGSVGGMASAGLSPCGFNTYALRGTDAFNASTDVQVVRGAGSYKLVGTMDHFLLIDEVGFKGRQKRVGQPGESGKIIRESTLAAYVKGNRDPHVFEPPGSHGPYPRLQLFPAPGQYPQTDPGAPDRFNNPHAWGMAIDMTACIGCMACVVACQAENNVPVVGKENVEINREMHWLRIDRYFKGNRDDPNPQVVHQPMMCVHCENAPCEQVCPVAATVHDTEGLNTMVYNRCIGTRYCSNNCPYKVRRFNYYDWVATGPRSGRYRLPFLGMPDAQQAEVDALRQLGFNPEVTVRMRGVMEKCTYCTQRIASAKITARNEWKKGLRETDRVRDFEVVSACQQACPTEAIVFGDLNDADSTVRKVQANPRSYAVLDELNTRPRTKYLAKLRNPAREPATPAPGHENAAPAGHGA